jgi:hypothetical protein
MVRASGEDKYFKSYLLLARRAGGYYFRNFYGSISRCTVAGVDADEVFQP